jgi:hypothetical protein
LNDGLGGAQAEVFEEIPTMDFPFEGIPTVPPRKDMDHFAFFCDGCRYRVKGTIDQKASEIKKALWEGGCGRGGEMTTGKRKLIPAYVPVHPRFRSVLSPHPHHPLVCDIGPAESARFPRTSGG